MASNKNKSAPPSLDLDASTDWAESETVPAAVAPVRPAPPLVRVKVNDKATSWRGREGTVEITRDFFKKQREKPPVLQESVLVTLDSGMTCYQHVSSLDLVD
jgi:hypothetical protein